MDYIISQQTYSQNNPPLDDFNSLSKRVSNNPEPFHDTILNEKSSHSRSISFSSYNPAHPRSISSSTTDSSIHSPLTPYSISPMPPVIPLDPDTFIKRPVLNMRPTSILSELLRSPSKSPTLMENDVNSNILDSNSKTLSLIPKNFELQLPPDVPQCISTRKISSITFVENSSSKMIRSKSDSYSLKDKQKDLLEKDLLLGMNEFRPHIKFSPQEPIRAFTDFETQKSISIVISRESSPVRKPKSILVKDNGGDENIPKPKSILIRNISETNLNSNSMDMSLTPKPLHKVETLGHVMTRTVSSESKSSQPKKSILVKDVRATSMDLGNGQVNKIGLGCDNCETKSKPSTLQFVIEQSQCKATRVRGRSPPPIIPQPYIFHEDDLVDEEESARGEEEDKEGEGEGEEEEEEGEQDEGKGKFLKENMNMKLQSSRNSRNSSGIDFGLRINLYENEEILDDDDDGDADDDEDDDEDDEDDVDDDDGDQINGMKNLNNDDSDFVAGSLDEDLMLTEAAKKLRPIEPQDIDPTFPTESEEEGDDEDEEDEEENCNSDSENATYHSKKLLKNTSTNTLRTSSRNTSRRGSRSGSKEVHLNKFQHTPPIFNKAPISMGKKWIGGVELQRSRSVPQRTSRNMNYTNLIESKHIRSRSQSSSRKLKIDSTFSKTAPRDIMTNEKDSVQKIKALMSGEVTAPKIQMGIKRLEKSE